MFKRSGIIRRGLPTLILGSLFLSTMTVQAHAAADIKIGVITSTTGGLKSYGEAYLAGLEWGLNYYTKGTMRVGNSRIVISKKDDAGDASAAVEAFKDMVGNGTKIIVGSASSAVALTLAPLAAQNKVLFISGPAKNDAITTSTNKYVFRSGSTSLQDLSTLGGIKPMKGKKVLVFAEDNAYGAGYITAARKVLAPQGALIDEIKVAVTASDFTPYAKKASDARADYILIAWSNTITVSTMLTALKQQGVFLKTRPVTNLPGVATYDSYGAIFEGANPVLATSYFPGVTKTPSADAISNDYASSGRSQDLFTPDGVNAAQMILRALKGNSAIDISQAITSLEGYSFDGIKGLMKVRATDHILIQSMFITTLDRVGLHFKPRLVKTIYSVAP